ncbi:MAG: lamin tail domain-containing protein [Chloroflexi bacterium]|nr:lamin tail domain-containing protein [Chloroflexota bacterium]
MSQNSGQSNTRWIVAAAFFGLAALGIINLLSINGLNTQSSNLQATQAALNQTLAVVPSQVAQAARATQQAVASADAATAAVQAATAAAINEELAAALSSGLTATADTQNLAATADAQAAATQAQLSTEAAVAAVTQQALAVLTNLPVGLTEIATLWTPTPSPTFTPTPSPTFTPSPSPTFTPSPSPTSTFTRTPTLAPSPVPTLSPFYIGQLPGDVMQELLALDFIPEISGILGVEIAQQKLELRDSPAAFEVIDERRTHFVMRAQISQQPSPVADGVCGLALRAGDDANYYTVAIGGDGLVRYGLLNNGRAQVVTPVQVNVGTDLSADVLVTAIGGRITVFVNGLFVGQLIDTRFVSGDVALWGSAASSGFICNFDNIWVWDLGEDIPITPIPTNTPLAPVPTYRPTLTPPPPSPTHATPSAGQIEIVAVTGAGDLAAEGVEIRNNGARLNLNNWTLSDDDGNVYTFPPFELFPSGSFTVFTRQGDDTPIALYWNRDEAVWDEGDVLTLADADGNLLAALTIGG